MLKETTNTSRSPFEMTAGPEFYYPGWLHEEALQHLSYGIEERKGIMLLTGDRGTGKTTVCRHLLGELGSNMKSSFILNPSLSSIQLLKAILQNFGVRDMVCNKFEVIERLNQFLIAETLCGNNVVLVIDEAQKLRPSELEQIRLLSNLETEKHKLLQIILCGAPQLHEKLQLTSLRQINQRISVRFHISALKGDEVTAYINARLRYHQQNSEHTAMPIFTDDACRQIALHTKGIPRTINLLCDRILLAAHSLQISTIDENIIHQCVDNIL
jgi:general secretion pathway protein A